MPPLQGDDAQVVVGLGMQRIDLQGLAKESTRRGPITSPPVLHALVEELLGVVDRLRGVDVHGLSAPLLWGGEGFRLVEKVADDSPEGVQRRPHTIKKVMVGGEGG